MQLSLKWRDCRKTIFSSSQFLRHHTEYYYFALVDLYTETSLTRLTYLGHLLKRNSLSTCKIKSAVMIFAYTSTLLLLNKI